MVQPVDTNACFSYLLSVKKKGNKNPVRPALSLTYS